MNLALMLELYRRNAVPFTKQAMADFARLAPAVQTELLFYMIMDFASNNAQEATPDVAGTA